MKLINGIVVFNTEGAYFGTFAKKSDMEDITIISNYIKECIQNGKNVIILSHKANLYNVNLNRNNGDFDLYLLGNFGSKGEQGVIDKIKELKNTIVLTEKDKDSFGQEAVNVRNYVINNYHNIGEIQEYSIYSLDEKNNDK